MDDKLATSPRRDSTMMIILTGSLNIIPALSATVSGVLSSLVVLLLISMAIVTIFPVDFYLFLSETRKIEELRLMVIQMNYTYSSRGRFRISGKGLRVYKGSGVCFADLISFFLNIP